VIDFIIAHAVGGLLVFFRALPSNWCVALGRAFGALAFSLKIRSGILMHNLEIAFPEKSPSERRTLARAVYISFGTFLGEWLSFRARGSKGVADMIRCDAPEVIEAAVAEGKGLVFYTAHFGNWELAGWYIAQHAAPFSAVMNSLKNPWLDRMFEKLHEESGIGTIYKGGSIPKINDVLNRKGSVGMLADQNAGSKGVFIDFLGRSASFHRGPVMISIEKQCPLVCIIPVPDGPGKWILECHRIKSRSTGDLDADVSAMVSDYAQIVEDAIRRFPQHWFWFHNRWKTRPRRGTA